MADDPWAAFSPQAAPSTGAAADPWSAFNPQGATSKAELPDVGPPAITAGQQQFSPGVPAVNEEVERIARSANKNLIEPITHPIDTLTGLGKLGAGAAQYAGQGALGEEFKPYVDALAKDYAETYGSLPGFKKALVEDPVRVAMDASMGMGALRGLGRRAGVVPRPAPRVDVPTTQELHDASQGHYGAVHGLGVEMRPGFGHDIADNILNELHAESYRDYLAPKTFSAIEELRLPAGQNVGTQDIEGVRRLLNRVAADPVERDAARRAIGQIDDALANLDPADAVVNAHFAPRVAQEVTRARGDYAAYRQAQQIEEATDRASLQAASTGSGANIDNATRQKFRAILTNPKKLRSYSADEIAQMRQVVEGTSAANAARLVGKLAPSGIVSGGLSAALGHAIGHTAGVPIVGYVAKQLADAATARAAARLSEQRRLRSPEARRIGAVAAPPLLPRAAIGVPRTMAQYGRLSNQSNPYGDQTRADGGRIPGMIRPGTIDLNNRPVVHNADGTISTVRSIGANVGDKEMLLPTVYGQSILSNDDAVRLYRMSGQHLGEFDTPENSDAYARSLHEDQARLYQGRASGGRIRYATSNPYAP